MSAPTTAPRRRSWATATLGNGKRISKVEDVGDKLQVEIDQRGKINPGAGCRGCGAAPAGSEQTPAGSFVGRVARVPSVCCLS
jgi:hypothetical protein